MHCVFSIGVCRHGKEYHKHSFITLTVPTVAQALMSLFVLASKDGWVNIMYHGLDAVGVDQQVLAFNT